MSLVARRLLPPALREKSVLLDRRTIRAHGPWLLLAAGILIGAAVWFTAEFAVSDPRRVPGGSSRVGFCLGLAAGAIFIFEFLYWPRRFSQVRTWRIGRAETWLRAHIWLGFVTLPLVLLHSGFTLGGPFTTLFFVLFLIVYFSGVFGLVMQQIIPRLLLDEMPEETIHSQIHAVMRQHLHDAERLVARVTGDVGVVSGEDFDAEGEEIVRIGSARRVGTLRERMRYHADQAEQVPHTEALCDALERDIRPFLQAEPARHTLLGTPGKASVYFAELRRRLPNAAHSAVDRLETICARHRQLRRQRHLYFWLHAWLAVHLPFSVALMIFLILHVVTALQYSGVPLLAP